MAGELDADAKFPSASLALTRIFLKPLSPIAPLELSVGNMGEGGPAAVKNT